MQKVSNNVGLESSRNQVVTVAIVFKLIQSVSQ